MVGSVICFGVCIFSTMVGAISGIGGGVIIKPLLDMTLSGLGTKKISLLSAFSVLSMSLFSIGKNYVQKSQQQKLSMKIAVPLAASSTAGGVIGKLLFNVLSAHNEGYALTLVTCTPVGEGTHRLLIYAAMQP